MLGDHELIVSRKVIGKEERKLNSNKQEQEKERRRDGREGGRLKKEGKKERVNIEQ